MSEESTLLLKSIGLYRSDAKAPYEAARQPLERVTTLGEVTLHSGHMYEQALEDLVGFDRIWLIYHFHHNSNWKPKVLPPRGTDKKVGVFSTRAPYRPNPVGISCVKLVSVNGLKLTVEGADLLDGTPIFDIKPYLPYADAFLEAKTGWLGTPTPYQVVFSEPAEARLEFLRSAGLTSFRDFILNQLEYDPFNEDKKRVSLVSESEAILAYKTWRVRFRLEESTSTVTADDVFSGYSAEELAATEDRYQDKGVHQAFILRFKNK